MATDVRTARARPRVARAAIASRTLALVEAHPVLTVFLLALAARVAVAVALSVLHPNDIAPDGIQYNGLASDQATGHTAAWSPYQHWLYTRVGTLLVPITALYELFGAHQLLGQLYVALLGAGVAAVTTRLALEALPLRWALAVGVIAALLPSQVIWSSVVLKDAAVWLVLAGLALTLAIAGRTERPTRLLALGLIAAALLVLLGYLRLQTLVVAAWALMLAALVGPRLQRAPRIGGAIALGVLVPWLVFSMGPAGITYVKNSQAPTTLRANNAIGAKSAISPPPPPPPPPAASSAAPGSGASASDQGEVTADIHHLPKGLAAVLAEPFPWQSGGSLYLNLARIQDLIWYPLLLVGLIGLLSLRPRHLRVMAFPLLAGGAILLLYALTEGNLGTAFRHRGEFEWVVALLAGFGLMSIAGWWSRRRAAPAAITHEATG